MSRNTNYQTIVVAQLKLMSEALSSPGGGAATEATALAILAALNSIDLNLTNNTNTLLTQIRDSNVTQEALITSTNTLLSDIRLDLADLEAQQVITNTQLIDANTELDNIEATLNSMEVADAAFYVNLLAQQGAIATLLTSIGVDTTTIIARLDTLITQTDQVETLLGSIIGALATNSSVNAAALEQLRLLLVSIDANTDGIEIELTNIIAEHDQTQVLLTNTNSLLSGMETDLDSMNIFLSDISGLLDDANNVIRNQDNPSAPTHEGLSVVSKREDILSISTSANGDYQLIKSTDKGEVYIKDIDVLNSLTTDIKPLLEDIENHTDGTTTELGEIKILVNNTGLYSHADLPPGATIYSANSFKEFEFIVLVGTASVTINASALTYSALSKVDGFKLKDNSGINQTIAINLAVGAQVRVIYKSV